ncbi:MAG: type II toxin-antitoxin system VapC family toxin [Chloroflexi bacterium]|nr:MAG: type II toxin-antitoxin system VapC family toxin [Chloroflexota bacterium]
MLIDSNIIIYAAQLERSDLRHLIATHAPFVSAVSYVEVLGYHQLSDAERQHFTAFFESATVLAITTPVLEQSVKLRQLKKMTLGDALIAATCLVHSLTLITRNKKDFDWIPNLPVIDPFTETIDNLENQSE